MAAAVTWPCMAVFCVNKWLNSYSTHLKAGAGGFHGRKLEKGDELPFKESSIYFAGLLKPGKELEVLKWQVDYRQHLPAPERDTYYKRQ